MIQERKGWMDCIYFDFEKAFDTVLHNNLFVNMRKQANITGKLER